MGDEAGTIGGRTPVTGHDDPRGELRVFAIQYRLDLAHAESYESYRAAMRSLVETMVVPHRVPGRPTLIVFPESIGLPTIAIGERGAAFRALNSELAPPSAGDVGMPEAMARGVLSLNQAYASQIAASYEAFGPIDERKQLFVAAADTAVRAFSHTFSEIASDYGVYVVAGNYQPQFRETRDPDEVAAFADPAVGADRAFVATSARVCNATFLWGPDAVREEGPECERNLLVRNEKIPLTEMEEHLLGIDAGESAGVGARANAGPVTIAGFRVGFATSLPAFKFGYDFGDRPEGFDPFADLNQSYASAQDALGVDVMVQADANPGPWATPVANGAWQPLEWMSSTWRAVADPSVRFRYNVTPMMTGNLLDLPFDGQSSITARGHEGEPRHYVGNLESGPGDPAEYDVYRGDKREFLALAPWVVPDARRQELLQTMMGLLPGSGSPIENCYVETAIFADLIPDAS